jgi:molecular chaperone GrpE
VTAEFPEGEPVIRDKRRIDPATGAVRPDAPGVSDAAQPGAAPSMTPPMNVGGPNDGAAEAELAERTADLQRVQAEYANYRKRVERDREAVRELAVIGVLSGLLPVLDDIGRARDHGEVVGGFKVVAESLEATLNKLGLQSFGAEGDPFDPNVHEALMHEFSADVTEATCVAVLQPGYRVGERVVRPARVKVAEPELVDPTGGETIQEN